MTTETKTVCTWQEVVDAESGHVFVKRFDEGLCFMILRGPCAICAYVGLPSTHPLAGHNYDDLPVRAHGGLTFGQEGNGKVFQEGMYWYGWDYGHCDDKSTYDEAGHSGKEWTPQEVDADSWETIYDFKRLVKLSEAIFRKSERQLSQIGGQQ